MKSAHPISVQSARARSTLGSETDLVPTEMRSRIHRKCFRVSLSHEGGNKRGFVFPPGFQVGFCSENSVRFRVDPRNALHRWKPGFYEPSGASYAPPSEHVCGVGEHLQYTGLLCGLCAEAHYRSGPHRCSPCSSSSVQVTAPPLVFEAQRDHARD